MPPDRATEPSEQGDGHAEDQVPRRAVAVAQRPRVSGCDDPADRGVPERRVEREHLPGLREDRLRVREPNPRAEHRGEVARVVLDDLRQPGRQEHHVRLGHGRAPVPLRAAPARPHRPAGREQLGGLRGGGGRLDPQNRSATPAASTGCWRYGPGTSPHRRGVGMTFPGLARCSGSKAQRSFWNAARSGSENIDGM